MLRTLGIAVAYFGIGTLLFAGMAKAMTFASFVLSLSAWSIIPESMRVWVALAVVVAELSVSLAWLTGLWRSGTTTLAMLLVAVFTAAFAWQVVLGDPPNCECFGRILAFSAERARSPSIILRNVAFLTAIGCWFLAQSTAASSHATTACRNPRHVGVRGGWTLVELIVVVVVLMVLIALVAPSLFLAHRAAKTATSISRLSEHARIFAIYSLDHQSAFPRFINPDGTHGPWGAPGEQPYPAESRYPYFAQSVFWPVALQAAYYAPQGWAADVFYPPQARVNQPQFTADLPYQYSATAVSRPEFWVATERTGPLQWTPVRTTEVHFPAQKVLLSAIVDRGTPSAEAHVALMDASAARQSPEDFEPGYPGGEGTFDGSWSTEASWPIGSHTISGVRGTDRSRRP
jgi:type II secretory pathway pseudopilin PulG